MTRMLEWLMGLEQIRLSDAGRLALRLSTPPEPWILAAGLGVVVALVVLAYRMQAATGPARVMLVICRLSAILLVMGLVSHPVIVLSRNRIDPSVVALLLDDSASMGVSQRQHPGDAPRQLRWEDSISALTGPHGLLSALSSHHRVQVWTFDSAARRIATLAAPRDLDDVAAQLSHIKPVGPRTDLPAALQTVLDENRGIRLAGIVIVSDGRQTSLADSDALLAAARDRRIPLHAVTAGDDRPRRDVCLLGIRTERDAYIKDMLGVSVRLSTTGYESPVPVTLELRDPRSGSLLALEHATVAPGKKQTELELRYQPKQAGLQTLQVRVLPRDDEDDLDNNIAQTSLRVHDEKVRVLYVESEPRFEYRYLKNVLLREPTLESSILLLSAAAGFAQEGTHPIRRFPVSPEELAAYHVVLLGDVDPRGDWLAPAQLRLLIDFVSLRGGGIGFLAGERAMPARLHLTPLEKLLPVQIDTQFSGRYDQTLLESFVPQLTDEGRRHPLFRLDVDPRSSTFGSNRRAAALSSLPGWFWYSRIAGVTPGAEVLAYHPTVRTIDGPMPLVVLGRYGAGRTFFIGSDDTWRWRRGSGEGYHEAYWIKLIHLLGRRARLGAESRWRLEVERTENALAEPVRLRLTADSVATAAASQQIAARIADARNEPIDSITLDRLGPSSLAFEGVCFPPAPGAYTATAHVPDDSAGPEPVSASFNISIADAERRQSEPDHALLQRFAARTGGKCVDTRRAASLAADIPDQSIVIPDDVIEPLWDTRLAMLLFVLPIASEWLLRKMKGLA